MLEIGGSAGQILQRLAVGSGGFYMDIGPDSGCAHIGRLGRLPAEVNGFMDAMEVT